MNFSKKYLEAGVNLEESAKAVEKIKEVVQSTFNENVIAGIGPFAAAYSLKTEQYSEPLLVTSTDGVGTKILLHLQQKTYRKAGQDLVAMSSNDILTMGAKPLFFLDYIAGGKIDSVVVSEFVSGIADACREIGAALVGGETAEMPGVYKEGDYDLSGFIVGIAEKSRIPQPENLKAGDVLIGLESSGPHSNGYSLIRKIISDNRISLDEYDSTAEKTYAQMLLAPTILYHPAVLPLFEEGYILSAANITGGGFYENIPRILPENFKAVIEKGSFEIPYIFKKLQSLGNIPEEDMFNVFNMGVGFVLVVRPEDTDKVISQIEKSGVRAFKIGYLEEGSKGVELI